MYPLRYDISPPRPPPPTTKIIAKGNEWRGRRPQFTGSARTAKIEICIWYVLYGYVCIRT